MKNDNNCLQKWLDNPDRDYAEGVALFAQYSKNKALVRYFQTGTARFRMGKLVYEMGKLAKTAVTTVRADKWADEQPSVARQTPQTPCITGDKKGRIKVSVPGFILAAKKEISSLYALIDKRHLELFDLGTSNADDVVRIRKKILEERKPVIERADRLYRLKEEWFALEDGPARNRVANDIREMLAAPPEKQPTMVAPVETYGRVSLQTAVSGLSDLDLSKRRSALRSSITKTQNMLQYQTIRKGELPAPMPPGPKRDEYQKKLKTLQKEYNAVVAELERRSK
ncbi:MAG: hypothetical protein K6A41_04215 [Bacteroidales bacterium]|nr:hypothetical protein [Bacteroidales bacterium]